MRPIPIDLQKTLKKLTFPNIRLILSVLVCLSFVFSGTVTALAIELSTPELRAVTGQSVDIPIVVDKVDNLAGVKLVVKYDSNILAFKKGSKTEHTTSLMHIVNDKKPGLLIAVMAGAKGIRGENIPIILLTFDIKKDLKTEVITRLEIAEIQLMSDELKDIKYTTRINPITIAIE